MESYPQIMVDCSKMKKRNTGLFSFCKNLVYALSVTERNIKDIGVFAPQEAFGEFSEGMIKKKLNWWNSLYLSFPKQVKVWHQTYQLGRYHPTGKLKKVLTVHDLNFLYEREQKQLKSGLKTLQKNVSTSDKIVAISEYVKQDIQKYINLEGKDVQVIYNGCEIYKGVITSPKKMQERPFLFSLGTILAKKNFHVLPCLLYKTNFDLIIAGNLSSYADKIVQEAKKWGVEDRVHIIGSVEESVKHWYLKNCTAFLFPSIAEGFGLPVVEAMYYEKPLFLSQYTCLPEIGGDAAFYFSSGFEPESMQQELIGGLASFETSGKKEIMKKQLAKFSWEQAAREYSRLYASLL